MKTIIVSLVLLLTLILFYAFAPDVLYDCVGRGFELISDIGGE